jgi:GH35 family endo-1,4-beta-xylanase
VPRFVVDVPALDVYLADADDQPFRWELSASACQIAFARPREPYGLHVLLDRGRDAPLWVGATGLEDGDGLSLAAELVRSKRAQLESRLRRYRERGFTPQAQLEAQIGGAEGLLEVVEAGDALELAYARCRPVNGAQRMGCDASKMYRVKPDRFRRRFARLFDCATVTFYPSSDKQEDFEPAEGEYEFAGRDLVVGHLQRMGVAIEGRPLLWLHTIALPEWVRRRDFEWLLADLRRRVPAMVGHYGERIGTWEVVNELHDWADVLHLDHSQILDATRLACELTAAVSPGVERLISGTDAFGVYAAGGAREDGSPVAGRQWTPYTYFRDLVREAVRFEAIGVQIYAPYRDLADTVAMLERFESLGKPVIVTELGVPSEPVRGGISHDWTPAQQADWAERVYTILMSRPGVAGVLWYDFLDVQPFLPGGGLVDAECHPKAVYERIERLFVDAGRIAAVDEDRH